MFVFVKPGRSPDCCVQNLVRDEPPDLGVVVNRRRREEIRLAPRPAVGNQQGRRVRNPGARKQLDHVAEERHHRKRVLIAAESVEGMRQVQLEIEPRPRWSA